VNGPGALVISLDFELMWGVHDRTSGASYERNIRGVREAVPRILELFSQYDVHATWSTVGFLFYSDKSSLLADLPDMLPSYKDVRLNPYLYMQSNLGEVGPSDRYHFAPDLIQQIVQTPGQRVGTHTFSHYYCLAEGQSTDTFQADLRAALRIAERTGIRIESIVFPRNQVMPEYVEICKQLGVRSYRGNPPVWMYRHTEDETDSLAKRMARLLDAYLPLTSPVTLSWSEVNEGGMSNVRASRFLRPYSDKLRWLDRLRLRRIQSELTLAAKREQIYHLWWHPHNFGINLEQNLHFLQQILEHVRTLRTQHGMVSMNMEEVRNYVNATLR